MIFPTLSAWLTILVSQGYKIPLMGNWYGSLKKSRAIKTHETMWLSEQWSDNYVKIGEKLVLRRYFCL